MEEVRTEERLHCVYCHTNIINNKKYIGQTKEYPRERRWGRNGTGYKTQLYFWRAIEKYGWDNFRSEILRDDLTKEEADQSEIELIALYDTTNPSKGYNLAAGGGGPTGVSCPDDVKKKFSEMFSGEGNPFYGKHHTEDTRKVLSEQHIGMKASDDARTKMSQSQTERFKDPVERAKCGWEHTEEQKKAHSERMSGEGHPMFGKHHSEETKAKISDKHKKENLSEETLQKYRDAAKKRMENGFKEYLRQINIGRKPSEETRKKLSVANKGKKRSEETKRKMREAKNIVKILQYDKCGNFIQLWDSAQEVHNILNISLSKIYACCNKIRKSAGGYVWRKEHEPLTLEEILDFRTKNEGRYPGVSFNKRMNRWQAYIIVDGKQKHIGTYINKEDAIIARRMAEADMNSSKGCENAISIVQE